MTIFRVYKIHTTISKKHISGVVIMVFSKRVKNRKGQALVEMALSILIMLHIMLGIAEFGWLFKSHIIVTNVSREAARRAAVDSDKVYTDVISDIALQYDTEDAGITVAIIPKGGNVEATASQTYNTITPIVGDLVKAAWNGKIEVKTVMKSET